MTKFSNKASRLEIWRDIVSAKQEPELEEVAAGRDAEKALKSMVVDHLSWKTASIFHSKRVPKNVRSTNKGRYEIDLIVLSPKQISAIEIKNWSGRLRIDGDQWVQERRNGDEVIHDNPLEKNRVKLDCLCSLLETRHIRVPSAKVCRVIFWNKNLNVPLEIANRDEIVMNHELNHFLKDQKATSFAERFLISVMELCLDQEASMIAADGFFKAVPSSDYISAVEAISALETFDKIELLGGRVIAGDLLELRTGKGQVPLKSIPNGSSVRVHCKRNKIILFFSALLGSSPLISLSDPFSTVPVNPTDKILFHKAGEPKPEEISLSCIIRMVRG